MTQLTTRRWIARCVATAALGALAGCADDTDEENGESDTTEDDVSTVTAVATGDADEEHEFYFDPPMITVSEGESVRWEIESEQHSVTAFHPDNQFPNRIPEGAEPFDSDTLAEDDAFEQQFDAEGVYDYLCRPHQEEGMAGSVVVGEPDPDDQPGLEAPEEGEGVSDATVERLTTLNEEARMYLEERD